MDSKRYEECIFYLNTYGSNERIISFYVNHNQLKLACRYILEKVLKQWFHSLISHLQFFFIFLALFKYFACVCQRCNPDIFTENLLMPCFRRGEFSQLCELLKMFDPSLDVWINHLIGACRYLSRSNWFNLLYRVQLLMKVFFTTHQMIEFNFKILVN